MFSFFTLMACCASTSKRRIWPEAHARTSLRCFDNINVNNTKHLIRKHFALHCTTTFKTFFFHVIIRQPFEKFCIERYKDRKWSISLPFVFSYCLFGLERACFLTRLRSWPLSGLSLCCGFVIALHLFPCLSRMQSTLAQKVCILKCIVLLLNSYLGKTITLYLPREQWESTCFSSCIAIKISKMPETVLKNPISLRLV